MNTKIDTTDKGLNAGIIAAVALAATLLAAGFYYGPEAEPAPRTGTTTEESSSSFMRGREQWVRHESAELGLTFAYREKPDGYVTVPQPGDVLPGETALILYSAADYRALNEGKFGDESPTGIALAALANPEGLSSEEWVRQNDRSNFRLGSGTLSPVTVNGLPGVRYGWSGLYEGETVAVAKDKKIYLFSVAYLSPSDRVRADFDALIASVEFDR